MDLMKCKNCLWCKELEECETGELIGLCRRFPLIKVICNEDPFEAWPHVNVNDDYCGEFKNKNDNPTLPLQI